MDDNDCPAAEPLLNRRTILKFVAGAPLVATFGFVASPLLRYLKPTMEAGSFFQSADLPKAEQSVQFRKNDFPDIWTCIPFLLPVRYLVFNPEEYETRKIPAFIISTAANKVVAFSRICTHCRHTQPVNFLSNTAELPYIEQSKTPVLCCPCACDLSTFDPTDGRVLSGPAHRPLRRIDVSFDGECYRIIGLEQGGIA